MLDIIVKIHSIIDFLNKTKVKEFILFLLLFNIFFLWFFFVLQINSFFLWILTLSIMLFTWITSLILFVIILTILTHSKNPYFKKYKNIRIWNVSNISKLHKERKYTYDIILQVCIIVFNLFIYLSFIYLCLTIIYIYINNAHLSVFLW